MKKFILSLLLLLTLGFFSCHKVKEDGDTYKISKLKHSFLISQKYLVDKFRTSHQTFHEKMSFFYNVPAAYAFSDTRNLWESTYNDFLLLGPNFYSSELDYGYGQNSSNFDLFPLNAGYIDYTQANPSSGIIFDTVNYTSITSALLPTWNLVGGETNVSTGFHLLEFLFWGEDVSLNTTGTRSNADFLAVSNINNRRRYFLNSAKIHLYNSVQLLECNETYNNKIKRLDNKTFMKSLLGSISTFISEDFVKKGIEIPLNSQNSHLEISDFSDKTLGNLKAKVKALKYAFSLKEFLPAGDPYYFLEDFIKEKNPESMQKINDALSAIEYSFNTISSTFEVAISNTSSAAKLQQIIVDLNSIKTEIDNLKSEY